MALTNPVNLYDEFNALNGGGVDVAATCQWTLAEAPSFPVTLCVSCDDGLNWTDTLFTTANENVCAIGTCDTALVDFSGSFGLCVTGNAPNGVYVFRYRFLDSCPDEGFFSITVTEGNAAITFSRTNNACLYELVAEHPTKGTDEINIVAPSDDDISLAVSYRRKVLRYDLENCVGGADTLENVIVTSTKNTRESLTLGPQFPPGAGIDTADLGSNDLYYAHIISIYTSDWIAGETKINLFRVDVSPASGGPFDLDLSSVVFNGNYTTFINALRTKIGTEIIALGGTNSASCQFTVERDETIGDERVNIKFVCCHNPKNNNSYGNTKWWFGINKNDWEIEWIPNNGVGPIVENNFSNGVIQFFQSVFYYFGGDTYTYVIPNCQFYQDVNNCNITLNVGLCFNNNLNSPLYGDTEGNIVNFGTSNYNHIEVYPGVTPLMILRDNTTC